MKLFAHFTLASLIIGLATATANADGIVIPYRAAPGVYSNNGYGLPPTVLYGPFPQYQSVPPYRYYPGPFNYRWPVIYNQPYYGGNYGVNYGTNFRIGRGYVSHPRYPSYFRGGRNFMRGRR